MGSGTGDINVITHTAEKSSIYNLTQCEMFCFLVWFQLTKWQSCRKFSLLQFLCVSVECWQRAGLAEAGMRDCRMAEAGMRSSAGNPAGGGLSNSGTPVSRKVVPRYQCESPDDNQHQEQTYLWPYCSVMTGCVNSRGIYNPLCSRVRAAYSTGTLSAEGTPAPGSHCSFVVCMWSNPQQPPAKVCETKSLLRCMHHGSAPNQSCLVFFSHKPHQYFVLQALNFWLLSHDFFFLQQLAGFRLWVCFLLLFLPNIVVYGQPELQFKDLGQKRMIPCSSSFTSSCPTSINVNVNVKRCKCSSSHEISQGKKDTGEDGRSWWFFHDLFLEWFCFRIRSVSTPGSDGCQW